MLSKFNLAFNYGTISWLCLYFDQKHFFFNSSVYPGDLRKRQLTRVKPKRNHRGEIGRACWPTKANVKLSGVTSYSKTIILPIHADCEANKASCTSSTCQVKTLSQNLLDSQPISLVWPVVLIDYLHPDKYNIQKQLFYTQTEDAFAVS